MHDEQRFASFFRTNFLLSIIKCSFDIILQSKMVGGLHTSPVSFPTLFIDNYFYSQTAFTFNFLFCYLQTSRSLSPF